MKKTTTIRLTPGQVKRLGDLQTLAEDTYAKDPSKPGLIFAQMLPTLSSMKVAWVSHEDAIRIRDILMSTK